MNQQPRPSVTVILPPDNPIDIRVLTVGDPDDLHALVMAGPSLRLASDSVDRLLELADALKEAARRLQAAQIHAAHEQVSA